MRAREPDHVADITRDGVRLRYEIFGTAEPTLLLLPPWPLAGGAYWRFQTADLARDLRVIVADPRGTGQSDRPGERTAYAAAAHVADLLAILDAAGADDVVVAAHGCTVDWALRLAAATPRVRGIIALAPVLTAAGAPSPYPALAVTPDDPAAFADRLRDTIAAGLPEPYSLAALADLIATATDAGPATLRLALSALTDDSPATSARRGCPLSILRGADDPLVAADTITALAAGSGGDLTTLPDAGHFLARRHPARVNPLLRAFVHRVWPAPPIPAPVPLDSAPAGARRRGQRPRVLYVCSPIGLGHARRSLAVADELRLRRPDLDVHWLAQEPLTSVLREHGETIHPASTFLASECAVMDDAAHDHDLPALQAFGSMEETLFANFALYRDVIRDEPFDLVIADEAWEIDLFLSDVPHAKRAPQVWFTDVVAALPTPQGGELEALAAAELNGYMLDRLAAWPAQRDLSLFVGGPEDVPDLPMGPGLPSMQDWTRTHFEFPGYISGFDPAALPGRDELRAAFGWAPGEPVCLITVGGTAAGAALLRRVIAALPEARRLTPGLRMVVIAGPRIDPVTLGTAPGLETHGYTGGLHHRMAACDLAIVQGGLTSCMELTALGRPFLYVPLQRHFEQQLCVPHRLGRYQAGRRIDYQALRPDTLATAIRDTLAAPVRSLPVETGGAARAAQRILELL